MYGEQTNVIVRGMYSYVENSMRLVTKLDGCNLQFTCAYAYDGPNIHKMLTFFNFMFFFTKPLNVTVLFLLLFNDALRW